MLRPSFLLVMCAMAGVLFSSCDRSRVQIVADARAGAKAYQLATDPAARAMIATGLAASVLAATENEPGLPKPTATPVEIIADPSAYASAATASAADPPAYEATPSAAPPTPGPLASFLDRWGFRASVAGLGLLATCLGFFLASMWPSLGVWITPLAKWVDELAVVGGALVLLGGCMMWLGDHLWVLFVTAGLGVIVAAIRYRRRWLPLMLKLVKADPVDSRLVKLGRPKPPSSAP